MHMAPALFTFAQASTRTTDALLWIALIIVATIGGGFFILMMRRKLLAPEEHSSEANAGIMDSLRSMRDRGELSQAEFEAARRSMIEKAMSRKSVPGAPGKPGASGKSGKGLSE